MNYWFYIVCAYRKVLFENMYPCQPQSKSRRNCKTEKRFLLSSEARCLAVFLIPPLCMGAKRLCDNLILW